MGKTEQTSYYEKIKADYGEALKIIQEIKERKNEEVSSA